MNMCETYDEIVKRPSHGDRARRYALQKLVENGCLDSLYEHAQSYSRMDWIRNYALLALTKFAALSTKSASVAITLQEEEIPLDPEMDKNKLKKKAAKLLFLFLTTSKKPRKFKKIALMGLLVGKHWDYCDKLLNDSETEEWIRKTIIAAKKAQKK
ncbi:MAG: hypothetical protein ACTSQE_05040 [Candidatus Heimdallarchaeaceae archaeon]